MLVLHRLKDPSLDHRGPPKATGLSDAFGNVAALIMAEVVQRSIFAAVRTGVKHYADFLAMSQILANKYILPVPPTHKAGPSRPCEKHRWQLTVNSLMMQKTWLNAASGRAPGAMVGPPAKSRAVVR